MVNGSLDIIREVLTATNIVDIISPHVQLTKRGKEWVGVCPFHNDSRPSLNVSPDKQIYKCFACGAGGTALTFLKAYHKMEFREALEELAGRAGVTLPQYRRANDGAAGRTQLVQINDWAAGFFRAQLQGPAGRAARDYLTGRGVSVQIQQEFRLGYAPDAWDALIRAAAAKGHAAAGLLQAGLARKTQDGRCIDAFRNRVMYPIEDVMGRVIGFGARRLREEDQPKYLNSPETPLFRKSQSLYGLRQARNAIGNDRPAIICEGYMDVIALHQFGFANAIGCLGTALTDDHARLLKRYTGVVISVFDPDAAGVKAADRAVEICLAQGLEVRILPLPGELDPADFLREHGAAAFGELLKNAVEALEYKWREIAGHMRGADGGPRKKEAISRFLDVIARAADSRMLDEIDQSVLHNRLGSLLGMTPQDVAKAFRRPRRQQRPGAAAPDSGVSAVRTENPEESAQRVLLEVLLNEPGFFGQVAEVFEPLAFGDAEVRQIALEVRDLALTIEEFRFHDDLLPRLADERLTATAIALQQRGERKGNFERTVESAVARLVDHRERQETRQLHEKLKDGTAGRSDDDELLMKLHARHRARHESRLPAGDSLAARPGGR